MMHDERHYPDPSTFNPDRFFSKREPNGSVANKNVHPLNNFDPRDPASLVFGFGRRWKFMTTNGNSSLTHFSIESVRELLCRCSCVADHGKPPCCVRHSPTSWSCDWERILTRDRMGRRPNCVSTKESLLSPLEFLTVLLEEWSRLKRALYREARSMQRLLDSMKRSKLREALRTTYSPTTRLLMSYFM